MCMYINIHTHIHTVCTIPLWVPFKICHKFDHHIITNQGCFQDLPICIEKNIFIHHYILYIIYIIIAKF
jgi:hypothetical protein